MISDKAAKLIDQALQAAVDFDRVLADNAEGFLNASGFEVLKQEASDNLHKDSERFAKIHCGT
jgi:hypothetical protein